MFSLKHPGHLEGEKRGRKVRGKKVRERWVRGGKGDEGGGKGR